MPSKLKPAGSKGQALPVKILSLTLSWGSTETLVFFTVNLCPSCLTSTLAHSLVNPDCAGTVNRTKARSKFGYSRLPMGEIRTGRDESTHKLPPKEGTVKALSINHVRWAWPRPALGEAPSMGDKPWSGRVQSNNAEEEQRLEPLVRARDTHNKNMVTEEPKRTTTRIKRQLRQGECMMLWNCGMVLEFRTSVGWVRWSLDWRLVIWKITTF